MPAMKRFPESFENTKIVYWLGQEELDEENTSHQVSAHGDFLHELLRSIRKRWGEQAMYNELLIQKLTWLLFVYYPFIVPYHDFTKYPYSMYSLSLSLDFKKWRRDHRAGAIY